MLSEQKSLGVITIFTKFAAIFDNKERKGYEEEVQITETLCILNDGATYAFFLYKEGCSTRANS